MGEMEFKIRKKMFKKNDISFKILKKSIFDTIVDCVNPYCDYFSKYEKDKIKHHLRDLSKQFDRYSRVDLEYRCGTQLYRYNIGWGKSSSRHKNDIMINLQSVFTKSTLRTINYGACVSKYMIFILLVNDITEYYKMCDLIRENKHRYKYLHKVEIYIFSKQHNIAGRFKM